MSIFKREGERPWDDCWCSKASTAPGNPPRPNGFGKRSLRPVKRCGRSSCPTTVNAYATSSFYAVDRVASFLLDWKKDYDAGALVLADRYTTSNPIYQMTKLPKDEWDAYLSWVDDYEYGKLELPRPDRVIFLDMPVEVSQKMMTRRYEGDEAKKDVHESNVQFLNACREAALYTAERWNWSVVRCWEGEEPRTIDAIAADVFALATR